MLAPHGPKPATQRSAARLQFRNKAAHSRGFSAEGWCGPPDCGASSFDHLRHPLDFLQQLDGAPPYLNSFGIKFAPIMQSIHRVSFAAGAAPTMSQFICPCADAR